MKLFITLILMFLCATSFADEKKGRKPNADTNPCIELSVQDQLTYAHKVVLMNKGGLLSLTEAHQNMVVFSSTLCTVSDDVKTLTNKLSLIEKIK